MGVVFSSGFLDYPTRFVFLVLVFLGFSSESPTRWFLVLDCAQMDSKAKISKKCFLR